MGTLGNPKTWIPYMKSKECTQEICSLSCPQWCYMIFPPPPPFAYPDDNSQSSQTISPIMIAIIGILASAFLIASYYAIISKYCGNSTTGESNQPPNDETLVGNEGNYDHNIHIEPSNQQHEPWFISTKGLDEALIKKITLVKYKKSDGLIGSGDCLVCLGEFIEDDSLRLLPKCSHAFHVACIDTWLKSHSNCPLCRANIFSTHPQQPIPLQSPFSSLVIIENTNTNTNTNTNDDDHQEHGSSSENQIANEGISSSSGETSGNFRKIKFRTFSDLGSLGLRKGNQHCLSDVRVDEENVIRRSMSMDHCNETQISISNIVRDDHEEEDESLRMASSNSSSKTGVLQSIMSSVSFKRSFSSGGFLFSKNSRGSNVINPL